MTSHLSAPAPGRPSPSAQQPASTTTLTESPPKPRLRGWVHAVTAPLILAAGIVMIAIASNTADRVAVSVFTLTAINLFGTSAVYHLGTWSPRVNAALRRADHTNIFLVIAGTYTPLAVAILPPEKARTLLIIVWAGAIAGVALHNVWTQAPRWLNVPIYLALGWVAVAYLPDFWRLGSPAIVWLIVAGGLAYSVGAVVYGLKKPNIWPAWFGFHELFHVGTAIGISCHAVAIFLAITA